LSSAFFFGVGLGLFGAGGQLPFLSLVTQFNFSAGLVGKSAAKDVEAKANNTSAIKCFISFP
jgi:hypothetical protein